jgi:hypothetical protein
VPVAARWLIAGGIAVVLALISVILPESPVSVPISASIHRSGNVSMLLAGTPQDATSPACGCLHHNPPGGWRGIVLPAQELAISRQDDEPQGATQYDLSSAAPQSLGTLPQKFGVNVIVAVIAVRQDRLGANPTTLKRGEVLGESAERFRTDWLSIIVSGPLHINSRAVEPVAALSPPESQWVNLNYSDPENNAGETGLSVTTRFNLKALHDTTDEANALPILDVLGPTVRMWGSIVGVKYPYTPASWEGLVPGKEAEAFSLPAAFWSAPANPPPPGWYPEVVVQTEPPMFAARLTMRPAHLKDSPSINGSSGAGTGTVQITAPHIARDAASLVPKFAAANRNPTLWINDLPSIPNTADATTRPKPTEPGIATYNLVKEEFEYPPTPPVDGINVFGVISDLRFAEATADLTMGTSAENIGTMTPIELRNIRGRGVIGHHMVVPVQVNGSGASIHVIGDADTRINGLPVAQRRSWIASLISKENVGWLFGVAGALTLGNGARQRRRPTKRKQRKARV